MIPLRGDATPQERLAVKTRWATTTLLYNSILFGVFIATCSIVLMIAIDALTGIFGVDYSFTVYLGMLSVFAFTIPPLVLYGFRHQVQTTDRATLIGAGFGVGSVLFAIACAFLCAAIGSPPHVGWFALAATIWLIVSTVLSRLLWPIVRQFPPTVPVQDGSLCPHCAYSLIGSTTMQCPECGRPFTFDELGTTEEEFRELTKEVDS